MENETNLIDPFKLLLGSGVLYLSGNPVKNIDKLKDASGALAKAFGGLKGIAGLTGTAIGTYLIIKALQDLINKKKEETGPIGLYPNQMQNSNMNVL